ncbi:MAG: GTP 3',8-cyclase MoaA, partial [Dehalococcoidia bacterium]
VIRRINEEMPLEPVGKNYRGEVADRYRYVDGTGEVGVISSVSEPFCGSCTRIRLAPDGSVYTCLFAGQGHDLKTSLRAGASDEEMERLIKDIWCKRTDRYSEKRTSLTGSRAKKKVEMYRIGG